MKKILLICPLWIALLLQGCVLQGGNNAPNQNSVGVQQSPNQQLQAQSASALVFLDGRQLAFDVPPTLLSNRTLVPLRTIFEELGAKVQWNNTTKTVTATKGDRIVKLTINQKQAYKNGKPIQLDVAGTIINQRTLVPLRFVSESMGGLVGWEGQSKTVTISTCNYKEVTVNRVIDGDTIEVNWDGKMESMRLIGVDTPETVHPTKPVEPYGEEASKFTKTQLADQKVFVCLGVQERDQYGRLLGYVYMPNGSLFNGLLIGKGYAQVATFPPNVKWVDMLTYVQKDAMADKRGLWSLKGQTPPATGYDPGGKDRNCGDFATHAEAQRFFEQAGGPGADPHQLDSDGDGIACETLP